MAGPWQQLPSRKADHKRSVPVIHVYNHYLVVTCDLKKDVEVIRGSSLMSASLWGYEILEPRRDDIDVLWLFNGLLNSPEQTTNGLRAFMEKAKIIEECAEM